ncbi:DUF1801 domain-containing protein [Marinicella rhabdoformis]|uniref:DUF1801 domain-containing protein n=1 Tax=Marinicella rhabdoformis TaxID=2580566 RepID=UPI0012AECD92|nr:DUF1801 domain-containing protein [Marinicella rhabdoformis]
MGDSVQSKFNAFPEAACEKLMAIRAIIFQLSKEKEIGQITETLKWGEPSYLAKHGSTVRLSWRDKYPEYVSVYFNCNTILVEAFRELYPEAFEFIDNRELRLPIAEPLPKHELTACLSMALRYHTIKHLPLLGA